MNGASSANCCGARITRLSRRRSFTWSRRCRLRLFGDCFINQLNDVLMFLPTGETKRCGAIQLLDLRVRAAFEQQFDCFRLAVIARFRERRMPELVEPIERRAFLDQGLDELIIPFARRVYESVDVLE